MDKPQSGQGSFKNASEKLSHLILVSIIVISNVYFQVFFLRNSLLRVKTPMDGNMCYKKMI